MRKSVNKTDQTIKTYLPAKRIVFKPRDIKLAFWAITVFLISYILDVNLIVPLCLLVLYIYLEFSHKHMEHKEYNLLNITFLFSLIFVTSYIFIRNDWPIYYIPFCVIPMLSTILFGQPKVSLLLTVAYSVAVTFLGGRGIYAGALFLTSGIASSIIVYNIRRREAIISKGIIIGLLQMAALFFLEKFSVRGPAKYIILLLNGVISGVIVVGLLPVFEYLFKTVTNISLLELTDFNHPLLQRLIMEAPGTYHHSLIVGNMSEAACVAVDANGLLARIGSYYHDIGKLNKPSYFSENQQINESKHDSLSPTISKLVIMNHVKEGKELAEKYKLNNKIIDFILRHHGTSLVFYFYRRALETYEENQEVEEEKFRYPGPKPDTKEAAIVLLADSVEAAVRSLREPTHTKIEELVHKVINNKFIDGQLDECDLTLHELEKIAAVFIRLLSGIYHNRITYPEDASA